jgi:DNA-binding transcriptional ArsR family regulator
MRSDAAPEADDRLSVLLGRSRASVMRQLATPRTTTALATVLGLAPSTISEHLALLVSSAAARRFRRANKVYYELSDAGRALVRDFCEPASRSLSG